MDINSINLNLIEKSNITVLFPFVYNKEKILKFNNDNLFKLENEDLKDFLPYTKNFFGNYHQEENIPEKLSLPCIILNNEINYIEFIKDSKIDGKIDIKENNIKIFFFEKSIALLSITFEIKEKISKKDFTYYHHKLSTYEKRTKQVLKTNNDSEFKYYHQFIDSLVEKYVDKEKNIFNRSNLHSYNLLQTNTYEENEDTNNFIESLIQYRAKIDSVVLSRINPNDIQQTSNIKTIANENVVIHIGINNENHNNNFINREFFKKYNNNNFFIYIISLYQVCKLEQLIIKSFLKEKDSEDLDNMKKIKSEILYFIANGNFTKISNNSIRNNLYKFYRKSFEIKDLMFEIDTMSDKISNKLETIQENRKIERERYLNLLVFILTIASIVFAYIDYDRNNPNTNKEKSSSFNQSQSKSNNIEINESKN